MHHHVHEIRQYPLPLLMSRQPKPRISVLLGKNRNIIDNRSALSVAGTGSDNEKIRRRAYPAKINHHHISAVKLDGNPSRFDSKFFTVYFFFTHVKPALLIAYYFWLFQKKRGSHLWLPR